MGTRCVPSKTFCPFSKGCKWAYLVFHRKRLESCHGNNTRCYSVSFVMYISSAKFEEHCSNVSRDTLDSVFTVEVEQFTMSSLSSFA